MADEIWILDDEPIRISFNAKGYSFYKGGKGLPGAPIEAHLCLTATRGKEKILITSVSDLKGRVVIKSPDEALEFARLFTSMETHYLFQDIHYIEPRETLGVPGNGEYTNEYKNRLKLKPAACISKDNYFVIERNLVDRESKLFRATEHVGRDGAYSLVKSITLDRRSPIIYPIYQ